MTATEHFPDTPWAGNRRGFMGLPYASSNQTARGAVLGVPFDCGTHPLRIGSRQGPDAVREQSMLVRPYRVDRGGPSPLEVLAMIDRGNVALTSGRIEEAQYAIERAMAEILAADSTPFVIGGDGAIALPQMRALHVQFPDLVTVHVDAHTDSYPEPGYTTGTSFSRAAEEGVVQPEHSVHVGARGSTYLPGVIRATEDYGYHVIPFREFQDAGITATAEKVRQIVGTRPVYFCFDMDFYDPSCAPGVCTPTWGGATAREGLDLVRSLAGIHVVAADVNTVSPPHDVGGLAALLAAATLFELICLVADRVEHPNTHSDLPDTRA
jgi:arginase family enzyme